MTKVTEFKTDIERAECGGIAQTKARIKQDHTIREHSQLPNPECQFNPGIFILLWSLGTYHFATSSHFVSNSATIFLLGEFV